MFDTDPPTPRASQLPADAYRQLLRTLNLTLLAPPGESRDDRRRRDNAAIACIAALAPASDAEADLAAQFVVASEQWKHCLRLAQAPGTSLEQTVKWRTQAIKMMRQANSAIGLLLRLQAARRKGTGASEHQRNPSQAPEAGFAAGSADPEKPKPN